MIGRAEEQAATAFLDELVEAIERNDPLSVLALAGEAHRYYRDVILPAISDLDEVEAAAYGMEAIAYATLWGVERVEAAR